MRGTTIWLTGSFLLLASSGLLAGCGGSKPPPAESENTVESPPPTPEPEKTEAEPKTEEEAPPPKKADVPEPEFKEGMSVDAAIKVVPQGTPRLNMETETLSKPLMEMKVYEPCKPGNAHFKLRVAVWNGKAVGVDVTTANKSTKLSDCIKSRIRELTWDDKVKSLNTVEYQF